MSLCDDPLCQSDDFRHLSTVSVFETVDDLQLQVAAAELVDTNAGHQHDFSSSGQLMGAACGSEADGRDEDALPPEVGLNVGLLLTDETGITLESQPFDAEDRLAVALSKGSQALQMLRQSHFAILIRIDPGD